MCGIAGAVGLPGFAAGHMQRMLTAIRHRGPDDSGVWNEGGAWLGHRRLSIIDLSPAGHQPMVSHDGRLVLTYNGEIYNHDALRAELEPGLCAPWRGHSDSEVLLEAISRWGLEGALGKANGMFALALWDRRSRTLSLGRDRFGEKPLYYAQTAHGLAFASEMSALEAAPGLDLSISSHALGWYFRRGYFPPPLSIYQDVLQLPPACLLEWRSGHEPKLKAYWSIADVARRGVADRIEDEAEAHEALRGVLSEAVRLRMQADVPLGAFLSGGIDSSLVVALMQANATRPVKTFTMGFDAPELNEADHARAVAHHLGTDHTEHIVTADDALSVVGRLGHVLDQPFADSSIIPTLMVSEMARWHVTVCLSGDAGDEMFGGYQRYQTCPQLWRTLGRVPMRGLGGAALRSLPLPVMEAGLGFLKPLARRHSRQGALAPKLRRVGGWMEARGFMEFYDRFQSAWQHPEAILVDEGEGPALWRPCAHFDGDLEGMIFDDFVNYLPGDILTKVDRAAMSVGLEGRIPLLDPAVAELAWRLPPRMKARGGVGKIAFRRLLHDYVPAELVERPKMGFGVPLDGWLQGPLKDWADDLLSADRLKRQGLLDARETRGFWASVLKGDTRADTRIFSILILQAWLDAHGR